MQYVLYKPNPSNSGHAVNLSFQAKTKEGKVDPTFYITLLKQSSWDAEKKNGSFKASIGQAGKQINLKMGLHEMGGIARIIRQNRVKGDNDSTAKFFHTFADTSTQISFQGFTHEKFGAGFRLSVSQGQDKFSIAFTPDEAECILVFINTGLAKAFVAQDFTSYA